MKPLLLMYIALSTACTSKYRSGDFRDTSAILDVIFASSHYSSDIPKRIDTIHVLKNRFTSAMWPTTIDRFNIRYILDTGSARSKNGRWLHDEKVDNRLRYEVKNFNIQGDSAYVMIYHYNFVLDCHYMLKKNSGKWHITYEGCGSE